MRILWLTPYVPLPLFGGGTRVFHLMKAVASSYDIDLIASGESPQEGETQLDALRALCRTVEIVAPPASSRRRKRLLQLRALVSRRPAHYWMLYSPRLQARVDRALRERHYDLVMVEHSFLGYCALPEGMPTVLDQHNVECEILRRGARHERSAVRRAYNLLEATKFQADEQRICRAADLILATSAPDRDTMRRWADLPSCLVVPNGVDTTYFAPLPAGQGTGQGANLVFTGAMNYSPNTEAMLYFCAEIWPLIQEQAPHATLSIVGGGAPTEIVRLGQLPGVRVFGWVPDVRPHLAEAQVAIAPLRIGGGTRLKILEAMAMGRVVVSTSLGCEGLAVQDGQHLLVADSPEAFAARVTDVLRHPERRARLAQAGRRLVEERYDWTAIGRQLQAALDDLLSGEGQIAAPRAGDAALQLSSGTPGT